MPFAFTKRGSRSNIAEFIKQQVENGVDGKPVPDQALMESAKTAALAQLAMLSTKFNGALIIVEGHANEARTSLIVQVYGEDHA